VRAAFTVRSTSLAGEQEGGREVGGVTSFGAPPTPTPHLAATPCTTRNKLPQQPRARAAGQGTETPCGGWGTPRMGAHGGGVQGTCDAHYSTCQPDEAKTQRAEGVRARRGSGRRAEGGGPRGSLPRVGPRPTILLGWGREGGISLERQTREGLVSLGSAHDANGLKNQPAIHFPGPLGGLAVVRCRTRFAKAWRRKLCVKVQRGRSG